MSIFEYDGAKFSAAEKGINVSLIKLNKVKNYVNTIKTLDMSGIIEHKENIIANCDKILNICAVLDELSGIVTTARMNLMDNKGFASPYIFNNPISIFNNGSVYKSNIRNFSDKELSIYIDNYIKNNPEIKNIIYPTVTPEFMKEIGWNIDNKSVIELNLIIEKYDIKTQERLSHFLSQCSQESGCGIYRLEIASGEAYENRTDLGNIEPGDGPKYKGAGYIQLTGRNNYTDFAQHVNDNEVIEKGANYVAENYAWECAGYYWEKTDLNTQIDNGTTVEAVTQVVNGGSNGLEERKKYYDQISKLIAENHIISQK